VFLDLADEVVGVDTTLSGRMGQEAVVERPLGARVPPHDVLTVGVRCATEGELS
jgi:hypothetical protein